MCQAQPYVQTGRRWVADVDLEKFFERVHHDVLMGLMANRISDPRVLRLVRRYLEVANGTKVRRKAGRSRTFALSARRASSSTRSMPAAIPEYSK